MKFLSINNNKEFQYLYRKGTSVVGRYCIVYFKKRSNTSGKQEIRLGITASKKVGNAVKRNRARRLIRASFESVAPRLPQNLDVVIVARSAIVADEVKSGNVKSFLECRFLPVVESQKSGKKSNAEKYVKNVKSGGASVVTGKGKEQSYSTNVKHDQTDAPKSVPVSVEGKEKS